jgi:hypothetical protein
MLILHKKRCRKCPSDFKAVGHFVRLGRLKATLRPLCYFEVSLHFTSLIFINKESFNCSLQDESPYECSGNVQKLSLSSFIFVTRLMPQSYETHK